MLTLSLSLRLTSAPVLTTRTLTAETSESTSPTPSRPVEEDSEEEEEATEEVEAVMVEEARVATEEEVRLISPFVLRCERASVATSFP
jgi:hypothetical protein